MLATTVAGTLFSEYALRRGPFGHRRDAVVSGSLRFRWVGLLLYASSIPLALIQPLAALAFFLLSPVFYGVVLAWTERPRSM